MPGLGFPGSTSGKEPACQCRRHKRRGFSPWVGKIPWRRAWQPTPVLFSGESPGEQSLVGYNPKGHKELDMIEATEHACTHAQVAVFLLPTSWRTHIYSSASQSGLHVTMTCDDCKRSDAQPGLRIIGQEQQTEENKQLQEGIYSSCFWASTFWIEAWRFRQV